MLIVQIVVDSVECCCWLAYVTVPAGIADVTKNALGENGSWLAPWMA